MWKYVLPPVLAVVSLWVLMSTATTYYLYWLQESHDRVLNENVAAIQTAHNSQRSLRRLERGFLTGEPASAAVQRLEEVQMHSGAQQRLLAISAAPHSKQRAEQLARSLSQLNAAIDSSTETPPSASKLSTSDMPKALNGPKMATALDAIGQLTTLNNDIIRANQELIDSASVRRLRFGQIMNTARITFLFAGPLIGVWLGWRLSRKLQSSVGRIAGVLRQVPDDDPDDRQAARQADGLLENVRQQAETIVTSLQARLRELDVVQKEVIRSERLAAVGQLAASVAHELRNPLTSIKLLLQHAQQQRNLRQLDTDRLKLILDEITRMETIVEQFLAYSRNQPVHRTHHDIGDTLRRAIELLSGRASTQQVRIEHHLLPDVYVYADAEQLLQVFVNLIINAIEATPSGGLVVVGMVAANERIHIEFRDTGTGIPQSLLPRLFEPFATTKEHGTGLGLAVCRRIAEQHSAQLTGKNDKRGGAVFTFAMPAEFTHVRLFEAHVMPPTKHCELGTTL